MNLLHHLRDEGNGLFDAGRLSMPAPAVPQAVDEERP
jgi:hypothetical protein